MGMSLSSSMKHDWILFSVTVAKKYICLILFMLYVFKFAATNKNYNPNWQTKFVSIYNTNR